MQQVTRNQPIAFPASSCTPFRPQPFWAGYRSANTFAKVSQDGNRRYTALTHGRGFAVIHGKRDEVRPALYGMLPRRLSIVLAILALLTATDAFAEPSYLPGGDEVKNAVEARRGKTELSKLAASMAPGQWAELKHEMPRRTWSAPPPSKGLHIGTWSDDGHWDSRTGQFLYFGVRQTRKLIAYSEEQNTWRNIPFDGAANAPALKQKFGHQYSLNSFDPERSRLYTKHTGFDVLTETWFQLKATNQAIGSSSMCYEYFSAMDGIVNISRKPKSGTLGVLRLKDNAWKRLGRIPVHGYHSLGRHNPWREEVLFAGGNDSRSVGVLTKDGNFKAMKDFPLAVDRFTIRDSTVTVDPLSGRYLFMVPGKQFVEFDSEQNEYRLIDDFRKTKWPFYHYDGTVAAFIPEYGVTFWADSRKVHLYKHKLATGEPLPDAPPPAKPVK